MITVIKLPDRACGTVRELPVLFIDDHLLVVNKPAGIPVTLSPELPEPSALLPLLHAAVTEQKSWAVKLGLDYLMAANRPEPQTSGVLILARSHDVLTALADQLGSSKVASQHLALVRGGAPQDKFELDTRLVPHPDRPGQLRLDARKGKRYLTRCEVLDRFRGYTLLRCVPQPGRSGQIQAHLRHVRLPLVADPDRGGAGLFLSKLKRDYEPKKGQPERPLIGRPALHLETLQFRHPVTGAELTLTAPLPKDFAIALRYLRQFAG